jgi:hypothetical protein
MAEKSGALLPDAYRGREQAYIKHTLLKTYLLKLFLIVGMSARHLEIKELAYVDGFAGPWGDESEDLQSTSIAISLRVLSDCRKALLQHGINVQFRALYVEKAHAAFARLKDFLGRRPADGIDAEALPGDFTQLTPAIQEWARDAFALPQEREKRVLAVYRRNLVRLVPTQHPWRARSGYVRVLDPLKNRPKYHLVYLTTHPRGLIEFMEASDALDLVQKRVRAATKQRRRQEKTGMGELFNDAELVTDEEGHVSEAQVKDYWIRRLAGGPRRVDYAEFADMLEETDWFPSDLQRALGDLIKEGRVRNLDAVGKRRTRFVHFDKGERLKLLGESR